jgi:hypothetical protein
LRLHRGNIEIGGLVVGQMPNAPLIAALLGAIVARIAADDSTLDDAASTLFYVALTIWSWEELAHGVNWFRRLLGAGGLVFVAVGLATAL